MNGDAGLVGCLVERLATRLPHRTGTHGDNLVNDQIVTITRATLKEVSATSLVLVLEALLSLLEELSRPYGRTISTHPPHVLLSELYILSLLSECCLSHWDATSIVRAGASPTTANMPPPLRRAAFRPPISLDALLVRRVFEAIRIYMDPYPEGYALPHKLMLDDAPIEPVEPTSTGNGPTSSSGGGGSSWGESPKTPMSSRSDEVFNAPQVLEARIAEAENHVRLVVEYLTASSWPKAFEYFRSVLQRVRTTTPVQPMPSSPATTEEDKVGLVILRISTYFWVDRQGLTQIFHELASCFLHLRRPFQNTFSLSAPMLVTRWIARYPHEFEQLHTEHLRLDGAPDTLFDMTLTIGENMRRRGALYPLQTGLLFLMPDVFEVASGMREARGGSLAKKSAFLEGMRKMMRNRIDQALACHISLLYVARYFQAESDAALLSYAFDIQAEVRDTVFRRPPAGSSPSGNGGITGGGIGGGGGTSTSGSETGIVEAGRQDQDLITAAFISVIYLSFDLANDPLPSNCLAASAPLPWKIAVIQACTYFSRLENSQDFAPLFAAASAFVQFQIRALASQTAATYATGVPLPPRPAIVSQTVSMMCNILSFLNSSPMTLFQGEPSKPEDQAQFFRDNLEAFVSCLIVSDSSVRKLAISVAPRIFSEPSVMERRKAIKMPSQKFKMAFWRLTSLILSSMCDTISPFNLEEGMQSILSYLEARLLLVTSLPELSEFSDEIGERTACSVKLETLFLVSLCSADIETCQLVTSCIGMFLEECRIIDTASKGAKSSSTLLRNGDVFREIASREFRFTGLVAFQRRANSLLRKMQYPSNGILNAWEIAFENWLRLSKDLSAQAPETVAERTIVEWRNYSGFLASIGGICTASQCASLEEPAISGLRWIDRLSADNAEPLLDQFIRLSIQLLGCGNIRVRETMREVLSMEASPALFAPLFTALDKELDVLFTSVAEQPGSRNMETSVAFVEQAVSLLRAMVERLESPADDLGATWAVQLGAEALNFVRFLDALTDTASILRIKIKTCQLCDVVSKKKENLNMRDDVRIRNQLLETIFSWISRPHSPGDLPPGSGNGGGGPGSIHGPVGSAGAAGAAGSRPEEAARLQRDLNKACLRSLADITYRLPLQPNENQTEAGTSDIKSQLFHTYFNRFLYLLNLEQPEPSRPEYGSSIFREDTTTSSELTITILSNLLSSNLDVGLKRSLSIGYHENVEIRTAFVRVLCNILMQGTEFSNLSDTAVSEKYEELVELVTDDMSLALAMSSECPSSEVDELTVSLLNVFESHGLGFALLEALVKHEVEETESESELLRRTCVATKMLSVYAKWKGGAYLRSTLQKVVERLMMTADDLDFELDPARVNSQDELKKNAVQLQIVAKVFIDDICASSSRIPPEFRVICNIISSAVTKRFPEAKYTAVGAFIFLRFFCPAIVAPDVEGLVSDPPSKEMRRGLLLIAKIVQNLANNVLFGAKEPYMFPLNEFLSQNIYDVTNFLRKISVAPESMEKSVASDAVDFGASVALHRFVYDHWEQLRQRLATHKQRDHVRSPGERPRSRTPTMDTLKNLITNLGPPPLAVTWNKPQVTLNSPPAYSRFQNFMLRNAYRSTESYIAARAIYDGGESKDGVSIICVILRNIDAESIDYDTLMYYYLKIASRLWHKPFGLFIDATCYGGQNEPQDELFQRLEMLTPTELSRQLSRVYIYNMNSAFRKCFRRILRTAAKMEGGVFHPENVDYHLISSMQELQSHFHLSQLHLPKETISVVADTRYVHQQVTRLSRSRGEIEVIIKIGSQFVQITTTEKQEIHQGFGLDAIFNDIFRLSDIEQAPLSMYADDDTAFGLRADGGKIVMYFASAKKAEILQEIRGAKAKYSKDARAPKSYVRLVRPQDVPGTLLNISLSNLASTDHTLRISSYNLLGALCRSFKFAEAARMLCLKADICVPLDPSGFAISISEKLARTEPQLTTDFLMAFFLNWDSIPDEQKPLSLAYMSPWLPGLRTTVLTTETEGDKARENIGVFCRKLVDIALSDPFLKFTIEQNVWPSIYQDETLLDIFLDEVVKMGIAVGIQDEQAESLASVLTGIGTVTLRGKIISRLRKALNRSSVRPTKYLPDNAVWTEICVLLQFCVSLSFDSGVQAQLYLPEIFHVVTMLANTGTPGARFLVHRLLMNSIHAMCTSFTLDEVRLTKLRGALESLSEAKGELFTNTGSHGGGSGGSGGSNYGRDGASISTGQDPGMALAATEGLATILFELCAVAAPTVDTANAWRARWMSLVASTAFQNNPAIQPRAFTVMGCLAREEVDDDLLYQVLVSLQTSIGRFGDDNNRDMTVAIVTSLSKMMSKLSATSRYGLQLFWLGISLLRLVPAALFNYTALFLESVLANLGTSGDVRGARMVTYLMQGRAQLEDAALALDEAYGIHFSSDNFHFAVCACLVRGLTDPTTRPTALRLLSTFLELSAFDDEDKDQPRPATVADLRGSPYAALILARVLTADELRDYLWPLGEGLTTSGALPPLAQMHQLQDVSRMADRDVLLNTAMELVDFQYLEDGLQNRTLVWLSELAREKPNVIVHLCAPIGSILDDVLLHAQNSTTLESAHVLLQTLSSNTEFASVLDSTEMLKATLDDMGFGGLWRSGSFSNAHEQDDRCFSLTEKLIVLTIAYS